MARGDRHGPGGHYGGRDDPPRPRRSGQSSRGGQDSQSSRGDHSGQGSRGDHGGQSSHGGRARYPLAQAGYIEYDRVLFFSDAVFAIAITLLAVNLRVPASHGDGGTTTAQALNEALPSLVSFAVSFAVIGLFWFGHHGIFRYIVALDRRLIGLNLIFLGTIAFLPYPTELLNATSGTHPGASVFYAACGAAAGLAELAVWVYATHAKAGLTHRSASLVRQHYALRIARIPAVFLASIPIALVAPQVAPYTWVMIWILGLLINRLFPRESELELTGELPGQRAASGADADGSAAYVTLGSSVIPIDLTTGRTGKWVRLARKVAAIALAP